MWRVLGSGSGNMHELFIALSIHPGVDISTQRWR